MWEIGNVLSHDLTAWSSPVIGREGQPRMYHHLPPIKLSSYIFSWFFPPWKSCAQHWLAGWPSCQSLNNMVIGRPTRSCCLGHFWHGMFFFLLMPLQLLQLVVDFLTSFSCCVVILFHGKPLWIFYFKQAEAKFLKQTNEKIIGPHTFETQHTNYSILLNWQIKDKAGHLHLDWRELNWARLHSPVPEPIKEAMAFPAVCSAAKQTHHP